MSSMLSMPLSLRHSIFSFLLLPMRSCNVPASVKLRVMVSGFSVSVVAALHTVQLSSRHAKSSVSHLLEEGVDFFSHWNHMKKYYVWLSCDRVAYMPCLW